MRSEFPSDQMSPPARTDRDQVAALSLAISHALMAHRSLPDVLPACAEALVRHLDATFARIWLLNEPEQILVLAASAGLYTNLHGSHSRLPVGALKIGKIAQDRQPRITNHVLQETWVDKAWAQREGLVAFAGYPLIGGERVVGVMAMFSRHRLSAEILDGLRAIAGGIAQCIVRSQAEQAWRESEERLRLALASADIGTWNLNLLSGENVWDTRCKEMFGLPPEAEVSFETFLAGLHPEDRQRVEETVQRALDPEGTGTYNIEYRTIGLQDGGRERWLRAMGRSFFEEVNGVRRAVRFTGTAVDITDRKQTEQALRESEVRFRNMADYAPVMVWITQPDGSCTYLSKSWYEFTGQTPETGLGFGWLQVLHPDDRADAETIYVAANRNREVFRLDYRLLRQDGEYRWVIDSARPRFTTNGEFLGYIGSVIDITDRRQAEEALRRLNETLETQVKERTTQLLTKQAQLRALTAELGLAEQRERRRLATELHDYLAQLLALSRLKLSQARQGLKVDERLKETDEILRDCLAYTQTLVADLAPPLLQEFGLPVALKWLAEQMQRHELQVEVQIEPETVQLPDAHGVLLFQSVRELLLNVVKHAKTSRATTSLANSSEGHLRLTVCDEGCGFELAVNDHGIQKPNHFGLFSIRERMEALGGRFELESAPGQGTRATLVLPSASAGSPTAAAHGTPTLTGTGSIPQRTHVSLVRVLLVDDQTLVRQGVRSLLEANPQMRVIGEAGDGQEAVALARALKPDVIIMDINMPKMNGIEATRRIKQELPATQVIALSFHNSGTIEQAMRAAGAVAYVRKDAVAEQLSQAIKAVHRPSELSDVGFN